MADNELMHYGILGMKWGIRRYQNEDGSLTPAGRKRYGDGETRMKAVSKDKDASSETESSSSNSSNSFRPVQPAEQSRPKSLSEMSDAELNAFINRYNMEQRYKQIIESQNPKQESTMSKAKKFVKDVLYNAGKNALTSFATNKMSEALNNMFGAKKENDVANQAKAEVDRLKQELQKAMSNKNNNNRNGKGGSSDDEKSRIEVKTDKKKKSTEYIESVIKNRDAKERERKQREKLREEKEKRRRGF